LFDDEVLMKKERDDDGMWRRKSKGKWKWQNGGCFATSEASKDQVNLDADGHTKQTQNKM